MNWTERKEVFKTTSGLTVKRCYAPGDLAGFSYQEKLGQPGEYPYTRGVYPTMYRGRLWTRRQVCGFGTAEETNERLRFLIEQGQTGLNIVFDMPTHFCLDSDDPRSEGEVGVEGVAIDTIQDVDDLFQGIDLRKVSTSLISEPESIMILPMYVAIAARRGVAPAELAGTLQNDIYTGFAGCNVKCFPPKASEKMSTDLIVYCTREMPRWNPVSIVGYHYREAGATAVQEVALTLAAGIAYVEALLERGLKVDEFAPRLSFFFCCHNDFFEEIAKFRAARRLWARIMKERFKARDPRSMMLRFHTQTAGCSLTAQQPLNNIVRTTIQAMAAVLGGTQSLHTNSYDEALSLPSEDAVLIALRTQQIIAEESGIPNTVDPLGGSYFVENLTDELEALAEEYIRKIDNLGGMLKAVETGWVQREIAASAYRYQQEVDSGEQTVVGVNQYVLEEEQYIKVVRPNAIELEAKQLRRLAEFKKLRPERETTRSLDDVARAAEKDENLVPVVIQAVEKGATVGEIRQVLEKVYGSFENEPSDF